MTLPSSQEYIVNGEEYMRMIFYVSGSKRKGTAHMDLKKVVNNCRPVHVHVWLLEMCGLCLSSFECYVQNEKGKYLCRYLIVEMDGYPNAVITIEDYR